MMPAIAGAQAPELTCGSTQPGPCQQTVHYHHDDEWGSPLPPGSGCPAFVSEDFVHIVGDGNGVEHATVNKAQDAWFTSTFTGNDMTFTAYPPSSLTFDNQGDVTGVVGPPDAAVPVLTGKITEWFGASFNNKNSVNHGTVSVNASGGGESVMVHAVFHSQWAVGADPMGPPTRQFAMAHC
jgi:hypothetical protein